MVRHTAYPQKTLAIASRSPLHSKDNRFFQQSFVRSSSAGNSLEDAQKIPAYRGERTYRDRVTPKAPDFYKLNLFDESDVSSVLRNRSDSAITATALDAMGRPVPLATGELAQFKVRPNSSEPIDLFQIPAGTYYIQVSTRGGKAPYRLNITVERSCGCS